jgi:hypothetical protein
MKSIYNPFPMMCGRNGRLSSGQDFMGLVLKVSHYIGSSESWLERGFGKGSNTGKLDISEWKERDLRGALYADQLDTRMGSWYEKQSPTGLNMCIGLSHILLWTRKKYLHSGNISEAGSLTSGLG